MQANTLSTELKLLILANIVSKGDIETLLHYIGMGGAVLLQHSPHYIRRDIVA